MLDINVALSQPGSGCNEDRVGHARDIMWVIDGATGTGDRLTDTPSDAAWLADAASRALTLQVKQHPDLDLADLVRMAIYQCRSEFEGVRRGPPLPGETLPSAAFMVLRARKGEVEIASLGDCGALLEIDGVAQMVGTGQSPKELETIAHTEALLANAPELEGNDLIERLGPKLKQDRTRMNRPGGYWIFSLAPDAADHLRRARYPVADGQNIALASDGFLRLIEVFGCDTPESLLAAGNPRTAEALLGKLRKLENAPNSRKRFARVKLKDDASFLHATYRAAA